MASKQEQTSVWECEQGCDLTKGDICEHLEALLDPIDKGLQDENISSIPSKDIVRFTECAFSQHKCGYERHEQALTQKNLIESPPLEDELSQVGVIKEGVELVTARFADGMTFKQIAKKQSYTSRFAPSRYLRTILRDLKNMNFKGRKL